MLARLTRRSRPNRPVLALGALVAATILVAGVLLGPLGVRGPQGPSWLVQGLAPWSSLDRGWGTYLPERSWGTPREALNGDGWGLSPLKAQVTDYRFGEDAIAGWSDPSGTFDLGWAFWDGERPHVTERFNGVPNPLGEHGETIVDLRRFRENTPTHSYARLTTWLPPRLHPDDAAPPVRVELEGARVDDHALVLSATATNTGAKAATLHVVLKGWFPPKSAGAVTAGPDSLVMRLGGRIVVVAGLPARSRQASDEKGALDANLRSGGLRGDGPGRIGALAYKLELAAGQTIVLRFGVAEVGAPAAEVPSGSSPGGSSSVGGAPGDVPTGSPPGGGAPGGGAPGDVPAAAARAREVLAAAGDVIVVRASEAKTLFAGDVAAHGETYAAALGALLWNEAHYRWDGSNGHGGLGIKVNPDGLIILPDKWEFPWPASWDTAFQAVAVARADPALAADQLRFLFSDRWQQPDGHVPCAEWVMGDECPPVFAWAAWQVYERMGTGSATGRAFLAELYPRLAQQYVYWHTAKDLVRSPAGLFGGGFLGMDDLPRGGRAQVDGSAWVAFFARDLALIADELGDTAAAAGYRADRETIAAAVNTHLWDDASGFYYDQDRNGGLLKVRSYAGLVPLIAGIVPPARVPRILAALKDPSAFLAPDGIRSVAADDPAYVPGYAPSVNSNWLGPLWLPMETLIVESLGGIDPAFAADLRIRIVAGVERDRAASDGAFHEYFDGTTGVGLGADEQAGWTALVAELIATGWPKP